jgi:hypothetical protein
MAKMRKNPMMVVEGAEELIAALQSVGDRATGHLASTGR